MTTNLDLVSFDKLSIKILRSPGMAAMTWTGVGDLRHPEAELLTYLTGLVDGLVGQNFSVDFRGTSYLNSSMLSTILVFMRALHEKRIRTTLFFNSQTDWQKSASRCLRSLTVALPSISVKEN